MNKRLKELAEQAGLRFTQLMSNPMVPVVDGKETDLEKFAELIIRECSNRCGSQADQRNILKSFGFEVESNVKYTAPERNWSINSQYKREYNLPKGE
jgi:hypothetical protein